MSIIHEALKKVEASNNRQAKPLPKADKRNNLKTYALYLIMAALGFVCANLIFSFFTKPLHKVYSATAKQKTSLARPVLVNPATAPRASLPAASRESPGLKKEALPSLVLEGVFFSGEEGYALINNKIVKEGEKIMGVTVVRITLEGVELKSKDSITKLSSQNK